MKEIELKDAVFISSMSFVIGIALGGTFASARMKVLAIEAGVARYEVNQKTGVTKFVYIKP